MHCLGKERVIPPQGRESVLTELHSGHPGISKMKSLARGLVWWPWTGCWHRNDGETVQQLSAEPALTSVGSNAVLELADKALVTITCGLRWSPRGEDAVSGN